MTQTTDSLYLSVEQLARRFGMSKDTIWRWKRNHSQDFPRPVKLCGNTTRWRLADIEEWESKLKCGLIDRLEIDPDLMLLRKPVRRTNLEEVSTC